MQDFVGRDCRYDLGSDRLNDLMNLLHDADHVRAAVEPVLEQILTAADPQERLHRRGRGYEN